MQTTASLQRTAQLRPLSVSTPSVRKALGAWLNAKSELFTILCGFDCTRREVLRVNLCAFFMIVAAAAAETNLLVTFIFIALAAWQVYRLNQEDNDNKARRRMAFEQYTDAVGRAFAQYNTERMQQGEAPVTYDDIKLLKQKENSNE